MFKVERIPRQRAFTKTRRTEDLGQWEINASDPEFHQKTFVILPVQRFQQLRQPVMAGKYIKRLIFILLSGFQVVRLLPIGSNKLGQLIL